MNILIVDDHPLFRHALIQAVRYSLPQAQIHETAAVNEFYERLEMVLSLILSFWI